jgi:CBS-domain-containing membrane protein
MNPTTFVSAARRRVPVLHQDQSVGEALDAVLSAGVPALPVVDARERFVGVFGEREFIHAVFPKYFDALGSAGFVPKSLDAMLERGAPAAAEPVSQHMTTDDVEVGADPSDAELAEIFLHHRVLVVPIVEDGEVRGIVTRTDFFRALAERFRELTT